MNSVVSGLSCKYKIFADDIKMYLCFNSDDYAGSHQLAQGDIDSLVNTSKSWGLSMNVAKCKCLRFAPKSSILPYTGVSPYRIENSLIDFTLSHSDLGVCVDRTLRFHSNIRKNAVF